MTHNEILLSEYKSGSVISNGYPLMITIEPTNNCNLKCVMCPRELQTHGRGNISFELFKKIVDESSGLTQFMWLHYMGEPLMNNNIFEMIDYASDKGMQVGISTNGTMFTEGAIARLIKSKLYLIIISLDATTSETYEAVRGGGKYFERLEAGTESFLQKHRSENSEMYVSVQFINQSGNAHEKEIFERKWKQYDNERITVVIKQLTDWGSQLDYSSIGRPKVMSSPASCTEPYRTLIVNWNGRVSACCFDYDNKYNLGDVNTQTIREIWNGSAMQALRKSFSTKQYVGICGECSGINSDSLFVDEFSFYKEK